MGRSIAAVWGLAVTLLLSAPASANVDYQCMQLCQGRGMSYQYCTSACSYPAPGQGIPPGLPAPSQRQHLNLAEIDQQAQSARLMEAQRKLLDEQRRAMEQARQEPSQHQSAPGSGAAPQAVPDPDALLKARLDDVVNRGRALWPDFESVALSPNVDINRMMADLIMTSPFAAEILYYLGKHPAEATAISKMPSLQAGAELAAIESRVRPRLNQ
jgi:hypothetical protein